MAKDPKKTISDEEWRDEMVKLNLQIAKNKAFFERYEERRNRRIALDVLENKDVEEE